MAGGALNVKRFTYRVSCDKMVIMDESLVIDKSNALNDGGTTHHPPEVRELARQMWTYYDGRNCSAVSRRMLSTHNLRIPSQTIGRWADVDEWALQAKADLAAIAPDVREQTVSEILHGSLVASRGMNAFMRGELPADVQAEVDRLAVSAKDGEIDERTFGKLLDSTYARVDRLMKTRVQAYIAMMHMGGFSPVGSNAPELPRVSVAQSAEDYRAMTPEQRLAAERRLKESGNALPAKTGKRRR